MADNSVFISGAATGALADALDGLPPWATEDTAEKIESILKKSLGIQTKMLSELVKMNRGTGGSTTGSAGKNTKLNSELDDLIKTIKKERELREKEHKKDKDEFDKRKKRKKDEADQDILLLSIQAQLINFTRKIVSVYAQNIDTFDQLYEAGVNVVGGFDNLETGFAALKEMTALSGVQFTELARAMTKYSSAVNVFGAKNFARTVGQVSRELTGLGFNSKETAELLGSYLETQKNMGSLTSKTQDEVQKDLVQFGKRITGLSMATGIAKNKLMEEIQALSKSVEAQILSATIGADASLKTQEFIASFSDKKLGQEFLRMMSDQIKPLNQTFQNFQKLGMGGFGQQMATFANSMKGLSGPEAAKARADFVKANRNQINAMIQQANLYRQTSLSGEAESALSTLTGLIQEEQSYSEVRAEDRKKMEQTSEATKEMANAFEKFRGTLMRLFAPMTQFLNAITWAVEKFNDIIDLIKTGFDKIESFFTGKTSSGALADVIGGAIVGFVALTTTMKVFNGLFGNVIKSLFSWVGGKKAGGGAGSGGVAGPGGGMLEGLGKGVGGLGKGLGELLTALGKGGGDLIAGIMKGIAMGIAAFANPAILVGASILSGSIAILSVGLGAAAFVLGKTLPTLAEGFKAFGDIDGNNLIDVGKGIAALAGGLALFGAGSVVASAGAVFSKVLNFFSGGPIDQLKQFSALGPNLKIAADSISIMTNGLANLSSILANLQIDKLSQMVKSINDLNIVKAAAFALLGTGSGLPQSPSNAKKSGIESPSAVTPTANTETTKAKEASKSVGAGIEKPQADQSINTSISYQNSLTEQLLLVTKDLVSVNKDILKYTRAQS